MANSQLISPSPAMKSGFNRVDSPTRAAGDTMTLQGTVNITVFLLITLVLFGVVGWYAPNAIALVGSFIVALVVGLLTSFKPHLAPKTAIVYAVTEGYVLGYISKSYNDTYDGIVLQALGMTVGIFAVLLFLYKSRIIRPSANFKLAVAAGTGGIFLFYMATLLLGLFGVNVPLVNSSSNFGIIFSVLVVVLASANLVVDFDFIENGATSGAPKYMEWYGAFALMVTLVWLYLELLRLLAKLNSRR